MAQSSSRSESPLSDIGSDEFTETKFARSRSNSAMSSASNSGNESASGSTSTPHVRDGPPSKRRRLHPTAYDPATPQSAALAMPPSPGGSISSDTTTSVPQSPSFANLGLTHPLSTAYAAAQANPADPDASDYTQVTRCQWTNCSTPEQGNMDNLVRHIVDEHIPPRQKKYFCEWEGCNRKSMMHGSAYALKAHMRSHTKEKPFMCGVPECDRSFTRSDALAKHMRTVHETESLRPSDPVPKGHTGGVSGGANGLGTPTANGAKKLKLTFKGLKPATNGVAGSEATVEGGIPPLPTVSTGGRLLTRPDSAYADDPELATAVDMDAVPFQLPVPEDYYPTDIYNDMDDMERHLPPSQYFRLLRRQIRWAREETDELNKQLHDLKTTTDDFRGLPTTRSAANNTTEEAVNDRIRREEWSVVEAMLDKLLHLETEKAMADAGSKDELGGLVNGHDPWQVIRDFGLLTDKSDSAKQASDEAIQPYDDLKKSVEL